MTRTEKNAVHRTHDAKRMWRGGRVVECGSLATACEAAGSRLFPRREKPDDKNMWYVYILQSEKTGRYYTGYAEDLEKRLKQHNKGKTKSLKAHLPVRVLYAEKAPSKQEAYYRERQIKSYKGGKAFKRLLGDGNQGGMAEWLNAAVLKTAKLARASGVRIPLPPFDFNHQDGLATARESAGSRPEAGKTARSARVS